MASVSFIASRTRRLLSGFLVLTLATRILAADIAYCSSQNTGLYFAAVYNQYQSNGACHDTCKGSYAIAVISGAYCWCTNYAPASTVSTYDCSVACPGFGSDWCGNPSAGYYAYFLIDGALPLGTTGAASSTVSKSSSLLVSTTPSTTGSSTSILSTPNGGSTSLNVVATSQSSRTYQSVVKSTTTLIEASTEHPVFSYSTVSSSSVSTSSRTSIIPSQVTATQSLTEVYTSVTTVTGQVRTVLITPTPTTDSSLGSSSSVGSGGGNGGGGGVSPGKVVGIVVGVALGIGLVIGLGVWYWLRRRHQRNTSTTVDDAGVASITNNGIPSRQVSQISSAGLLSKGPRINTSGLPPGSGPRSAQSSQFNRQSLGTDQRLNPYAIYAQEESRNSNVSLQDNHDYSRQLRVANPDP